MKLKFVSELIQIASLRFIEALEGSKITDILQLTASRTEEILNTAVQATIVTWKHTCVEYATITGRKEPEAMKHKLIENREKTFLV